METTNVELMRQLLEAGVHFGHQTKKWNPKMKPFIFGNKGGIYIIDLSKTIVYLNEARAFVERITAAGGNILCVGTKRQAQSIIREQAVNTGSFFIVERWLGGTLTNFQTIRKSIARYRQIEKMKTDGVFNNLKKKEIASLEKELKKLDTNLGGIKEMETLPKAVFVIDSKNEETAVKEARKLGIPVVALIDTNCDPDLIDYPIPGNDDAIRAIKLITTLVCESVQIGKKQFAERRSEEAAAAAAAAEAAANVTAGDGIETRDDLLEVDDLMEKDNPEASKGKVVAKPRKATHVKGKRDSKE